MITLTQHLSTHLRRADTPQAERHSPRAPSHPIVDRNLALDHWQRLHRFLVSGSPGGTYYIGERDLTVEIAQAAMECLWEDGLLVVQRVVEISESGRAESNDPALFVLAIAASLGDDATWAAALAALPRVARTGTHLDHWLQYVNERTIAHLAREVGRRAD